MAKGKKISGKVKKERDRTYKIEPGQGEAVAYIEVLDDEEYVVDKLEMDQLPTHMPAPDGTKIRWLNNFSVSQDGKYIRKAYRVKIPELLNRGKSQLVIYEGAGDPYYYTGKIDGDTFELTNGDPSTGMAP